MTEQKKKNPGARAIAAGAKVENEKASRDTDRTQNTRLRATFFWDRRSGSVEPLKLLGCGVAV